MSLLNFLKKKPNKKRLEIYDSSGFIGIVNAQLYKTFIDTDWELDQVLERFRTETNNSHCIIWSLGTQNLMTIDLVDEFSNKNAFRAIKTQIQVTNGVLYLVNYDDLTMCAQYEDEKLPSDLHSELKIALENGIYDAHLKQFFDPENYDVEHYPNPCFELQLKKTAIESKSNFDKVIWWTD